jgi:transposase
MVWCGINGQGRVCLRRCHNNVDSDKYHKTLASALGFIRPRRKDVLFQQDGASIHKSASTMRWLRSNDVRLLNGGIWPALSPDLNPVEHVWPIVSKYLTDKVFNDKEELWVALKEGFGKTVLTSKFIKTLYDSMPRRIKAVIEARGGNTKY